jgi:hypothetical protein
VLFSSLPLPSSPAVQITPHHPILKHSLCLFFPYSERPSLTITQNNWLNNSFIYIFKHAEVILRYLCFRQRNSYHQHKSGSDVSFNSNPSLIAWTFLMAYVKQNSNVSVIKYFLFSHYSQKETHETNIYL